MNINILKYLKGYSFNVKDVNKLLVSSFLKINNISHVTNKFLTNYIISDDDDELESLQQFEALFKIKRFELEDLLELFEFVISPADKEVNGAVFTPSYIREYIVKESIRKYSLTSNDLNNIKFADIACGCGGFFLTIIKELRRISNKSYYEIFNENIYGVDIQKYSIERTKILLILEAILNGEDKLNFNFNLFLGNSLSFKWECIDAIKKNGGFDIIVGNPPYVGSSKIDEESKKLLKNWSVTKSGKSDLYIPFFEIGIENLNLNGVLGYITVNTFYRSLNGRALRAYFSKNETDITIIDFAGEQLFKNRSTYTCLCFITKHKSNEVKYVKTKSSNINKLKRNSYITLNYDELSNKDGWYLIDKAIKLIISKIQNTGVSLGNKYEIRNGFATLKNEVYVFKPLKEVAEYYFLEKDGINYKIEKKICRDVIKPNTLKLESEIENSIEKLIFPYSQNKDKKNASLQIYDERYLKKEFPHTYKYLLTQKSELADRDKKLREYEKWYAYGRNQALAISGLKLLFPYISNSPCFVYTSNKNLLFYNGYAIISQSEKDLMVLQKILMSKVFWFYIKYTSKPYSGNFMSLAKNYIKNFGVCDLEEHEQIDLLNLKGNEVDDFLLKKYNLEAFSKIIYGDI